MEIRIIKDKHRISKEIKKIEINKSYKQSES